MTAPLRDVHRASIAWREAGDGPLVVFLHGLGGTRVSWEPQLRSLSDRFRCVAWDAPGYGCSPPLPAPVTLHALAGAVVELLDILDTPRASLVGWSLGGQIAQHVALEAPDRVDRLVLIATSPRFGMDGTSADEWRAARRAPIDAGETPAAFAERVLRSVAGPDISDAAVAEQVAAMSRIAASGLRTMIDCIVMHDVLERLPQIAAPTLVVVGDHDTETPVAYAELLAERVPDGRLEIIAGAGHLLPAEAPERLHTLLRSFLEADR